MKDKEKQLLLKDLCARLPYGVKVTWDGEYPLIVTPHIYCAIASEDNINNLPKLLLRPLSSMTEEEAKELATLHGLKNILSVEITDKYIGVIIDDGVCNTVILTIWFDEIVSSIEIFDWLNKHHFDYRGLIEKGLAIEAPDGMYQKF